MSRTSLTVRATQKSCTATSTAKDATVVVWHYLKRMASRTVTQKSKLRLWMTSFVEFSPRKTSQEFQWWHQTLFQRCPHSHIDTKGVTKLLKNLDPHKAQGPDSIPPKFLKEVAEEIAPSLGIIFQASIGQGEVPDDWKQASVTPIFKKGDRTTPANYIPISLTSICCKTLEHIVHSQVMKHLEQHKILSDQQHGFRKRRSCESQLVLTVQDLTASLEVGEQIDAILLDI